MGSGAAGQTRFAGDSDVGLRSERSAFSIQDHVRNARFLDRVHSFISHFNHVIRCGQWGLERDHTDAECNLPFICFHRVLQGFPKLISGRSTANSSPPGRATESISRSVLCIVQTTTFRTKSPMACPRVSFMTLNPSRSRETTVIGVRFLREGFNLVAQNFPECTVVQRAGLRIFTRKFLRTKIQIQKHSY
jgi:hypothetical protein